MWKGWTSAIAGLHATVNQGCMLEALPVFHLPPEPSSTRAARTPRVCAVASPCTATPRVWWQGGALYPESTATLVSLAQAPRTPAIELRG